MPLIKQCGIGAFQVVHSRRQVWFRRLQKQVKVIGHKYVCEYFPAVADCHTMEESEPFPAIVVIANNVALINATVRDMEHTASNFNPNASRHLCPFLRGRGHDFWKLANLIAFGAHRRELPISKNCRPDPGQIAAPTSGYLA